MAKLNGHDPTAPSHADLNALTVMKDRMVIETICRATGRTDWLTDEEIPKMLGRGEWVQYLDGCEVFLFDGKECLLLHPPRVNEDGNWQQKLEYLYDKEDYAHHTKDDEAG